MISCISEFEEEEIFETELCIIGGGAAGIDIARFFDKTNKSVLLVESGGTDFDPNTQKLYEMKCIGKSIRDGGYDFNPHLVDRFKGECRARMFGGTTNIWSGKWKMLEPIDFEKKDWIPNSGWPISFEELLPFYKEIAREYSILDLNSSLNEDLQTEIVNSVLGGTKDIKYTIHYTEKLPLNFNTNLYKEELGKSKNVHILLNANAYELILENSCNKVEKLIIKTLEGKKYSVVARVFILACGGLENARLLLASNKQITTGIGNNNDLVGRFYMDHPKGKLGIVKPLSSYSLPNIFFGSKKEDKSYRVGFSLSEVKQRELRTLNHNFYLKPVYDRQINLVISTLTNFKIAISKRQLARLMFATKVLLKNFVFVCKFIIKTLINKPINKICHYEITHYLEQSPNYESRLFLGEEVDKLDMKKIIIDWKLSSIDKESFKRFINQIQKVFSEIGLGSLIIDKNYYDLKFVRDASHHMGTTRMGNTPDDGVVDLNCKVFGIDNLYIAGSSVFPTGGNANPTYTILALSRRLCRHLEKNVLTN